MSKEIKEAIELLGKSIEGTAYPNDGTSHYKVNPHIFHQALALLKQQPPAGEWTAEIKIALMTQTRLRPEQKEKVIIICDRLDRAEASNADLLEACLNSPATDMFEIYAKFAEECSLKPSMAVYRHRFICLATFLRSCENRAKKVGDAIAKAK